MRAQSEQHQQTKASQRVTTPMSSVSPCAECGDVDEDISAGAAICKRCVATEIALPAHTD